MAAALPFFTVISAAVSAISAFGQGGATASASRYNAQVSEQNAGIARSQAEAQAKQAERESYLRLGMIRAAQGRAGGTADGSVLDVLGDVAAQGELERQDILYRGELAARGHTNSATLDRQAADNAESSSFGKAGTELLGGFASYYNLSNRMTRF